MKFALPVVEVKKAVAGFRRIATERLGGVHVVGKGSGVTMSVNCGDEFASYEVPEGTGKGKTVVGLTALGDLLKCVRGDTIEIEDKGKNLELSYVEDLWQASFECPKPGLFYDVRKGPSSDLVPFPDFINLFRFAVPFSSKDETRFILNGVAFMEDGPVVATDGRRIVFSALGNVLGKTVIVPRNSWLQNTKLGEIEGVCLFEEADSRKDSVIPSVSRKMLFLKAENWSYGCKAIDGTYPNYLQVIPKGKLKSYVQFDESAVDALNFIKSIVGRKSQGSICVSISKQSRGLFLRAKNPYTDRIVKAKLQGDSHITTDTPECLSADFMLQAIKKGFTKHSFQDNESPLVSMNNGWTHVLMPMRTN